MLYIFNTTIATTPGLTYHTRTLTAEQARSIISDASEVTSAIGHDATAQIASVLLSRPVAVNRINAQMVSGDSAICVKLRGRPPEGVVLDAEEVETIGYDLVLMTACDQSAVADAIHRRTDPEADNCRPDAPPLEVCAARLVDRFDRAVSEVRHAYAEAGVSYSGGDVYGPIRAHMSRLCIVTTREAVGRIAEAEGTAELKALSVKMAVRKALIDALNADITGDQLTVDAERDGLPPDAVAQRDRVEARLFPAQGEPLPFEQPKPSRRDR